MFKSARVLFLFAETPLHAGTGTGLGVIDMPIQREKHTDYPIVQASGVKGAVRDWFERQDMNQADIDTLFGPESVSDDSGFAGAVAFTDARTTIFTVRSLRGVFAFITSELALHRLHKELTLSGIIPDWQPTGPADNQALCCAGSKLVKDRVAILEEYAFQVTESPEIEKAATWLSTHAFPADKAYDYWRNKMKTDLLVLPENAFRDFLKMSTDVRPHITIDEKTRTVKNGMLFYEECLPCDTLLSTTVLTMDSNNPSQKEDAKALQDKLATLDGKRIQMGGKASLGRGLLAARFASPATKE